MIRVSFKYYFKTFKTTSLVCYWSKATSLYGLRSANFEHTVVLKEPYDLSQSHFSYQFFAKVAHCRLFIGMNLE